MATFTTTASGNFSAGGTWVGGVAPSSVSDDIIVAAHTVTLDVDVDCNTMTFNNASSRLALSGSVTRTVKAANGFLVSAGINAALCGTLTSGQDLTFEGAWAGTNGTNGNNRIADSTGGNLTLKTVGNSQSTTLWTVASNSVLRICNSWTAGALVTTGLFNNTSTASSGNTLVTMSGGSWTHNSSGTNTFGAATQAYIVLTQTGTASLTWTGDVVAYCNNSSVFSCVGNAGDSWTGNFTFNGTNSPSGGASYGFNIVNSGTRTITGTIQHTSNHRVIDLFVSAVSATVNYRSQSITIGASYELQIRCVSGSLDISNLAITNSGQVSIAFDSLGNATLTGASITNQTSSAGAAVVGRTGVSIVNVASPAPTLPAAEDVTLGTVYGYTGAEITGTALLVDNTILAAATTTSLQGIHLHKLFASAYDASSKPGDADGLLNKLMENAGSGVPRYTAASLVNAGGGGGGLDAAGVRAAIGMASANMDTQLSGISDKTVNLPASPAAVGSAMTLSGDFTNTMKTSITTAATAATPTVTAGTVSDKTGYSLTAGERTAIANEVEAQIIDDTDSEKVLQAIIDKIAAANPSLDDLTLGAISSAVRTELTPELALIDAAISSRLAAGSYTVPPTAAANATAVRNELTTELARLDTNVGSRLATGSYTAAPSALDVAIAVWDRLTSALSASGSIGKLIVDKLTPLTFSVTNRVDASAVVDVDEAAIASEVVSQLDTAGIAVTVTSQTLTDGGSVQIVIGDDYFDADDRPLTCRIEATGAGLLTDDEWTLFMYTPFVENQSVVGTATRVSDDILDLSFDVPSSVTSVLRAGDGDWQVKQTRQTSSRKITPVYGTLDVVADLSVLTR